jgi:hypothetical protein
MAAVGCRVDFAPEIIDSLGSGEIHSHKNGDFIDLLRAAE